MSSPSDLAREYTGLDVAARAHLERLMASWLMLADLSFSDLLLYVPLDQFSLAVAEPAPESRWHDSSGTSLSGLHFVVLGQMRPTTSQTLYDHDLVGQVFDAKELPLVVECWQRGAIVHGEQTPARESGAIRAQCVPVRSGGEIVAVMSRTWSPTIGRRNGGLERTYVRLFEQLVAMVADGRYPFVADEAEMEEAPRVGDGVVVFDAKEKVSFLSPNAVNALHRMGIVSSMIGSTLEEIGIGSEIIRTAIDKKVSVVEEIERRPDVIVLVRCIPLLDHDSVNGALLLMRDVTDLRRRDRLLLSKDAAIREVHHRVKNNLQTISSLLRLQSRRLDDRAAREALLEAERRIHAIAAVHEILARDPGEQVPFTEITPTLAQLALDANVERSDVKIEVEGDLGELEASVATSLAVVVTELLQNAVEHAFTPEMTAPVVVLRLAREDASLALEVHDNGVGFPPDFDVDTTQRLGLAIVRDLVRSQLGGSIDFTNVDGALVRLTIPITA